MSVDLGGYRTRYHYPTRWAVTAEILWRLEHSRIQRLAPFYLWRTRAEHRGYDARHTRRQRP